MSFAMAGCGDDPGPSKDTATEQNPQAGLDALKKLQEGPKPTAKGLSGTMQDVPKGGTLDPGKMNK
jgi:hypothetical protein